ncbi:hypothetical protein D3C72_1392160 [compost metagenome]
MPHRGRGPEIGSGRLEKGVIADQDAVQQKGFGQQACDGHGVGRRFGFHERSGAVGQRAGEQWRESLDNGDCRMGGR